MLVPRCGTVSSPRPNRNSLRRLRWEGRASAGRRGPNVFVCFERFQQCFPASYRPPPSPHHTHAGLGALLNLSVASFPSAVRPPCIFMTFPPRQIRPGYLESRLAPIHVIQHEGSPRNQPRTLFPFFFFFCPPLSLSLFLMGNVTLNILAGAMQLVLRLTIAGEEGGE